MRTNIKATGPKLTTREGAPAVRITPEKELRRSIMACLLWESSFYEDGVSIAERIKELVPKVKDVASIAVEARTKMKLRHAPLLLAREMARTNIHKPLVRETLASIIQRPDEITEFLSLYWKEGKVPIAAQVKKGLADAFTKFDSYQLSKYNRDDEIKLRDVLFMVHAKPKEGVSGYTSKDRKEGKARPEDAGSQLFGKLVDGTVETPDTWEVSLSTGKDKKVTWERLLTEHKLGALALLRNLRNMEEANVQPELIEKGLETLRVERVLPFRFITAARYAPKYEPQLETCMLKCLVDSIKLDQKTVLLIDVSGSMEQPISSKSELTRMDAACGLAILARELCSSVEIFTFSNKLVRIPARGGFALRDAIANSQEHQGTYLGSALTQLHTGTGKNFDGSNVFFSTVFKESKSLPVPYDRIIIFTDEQSHDQVPKPQGKGYVINVSTEQNGIGYGAWNHIDGFSEATLEYIKAYETLD